MFYALGRILAGTENKDLMVVPRIMKQYTHKLQNIFHSSEEQSEVGMAKRDRELYDACALPNGENWADIMDGLNFGDRYKLDLAYAYHGMPAPDADLEVLFDKAAKDMQSSNSYDEEFFTGFLKYAQASDLCKALYKTKAGTKWIADEGYDPTGKKWYSRAQQVPGVLPSKDEWGRARLFKHFAYNEEIDSWYMSASDVTRVIPTCEPYESQLAAKDVDQFQHNELLYAMKNAPMLADGVTPAQGLRDACKTVSPHTVVMAAKSQSARVKSQTTI